MKKLIAALLFLTTLSAYSQTAPITPSFRGVTPSPNPTDSIFTTWTGKPDGYSTLYTGRYIRTNFWNKTQSDARNILNQNTSAQTANFWISGSGRAANMFVEGGSGGQLMVGDPEILQKAIRVQRDNISFFDASSLGQRLQLTHDGTGTYIVNLPLTAGRLALTSNVQGLRDSVVYALGAKTQSIDGIKTIAPTLTVTTNQQEVHGFTIKPTLVNSGGYTNTQSVPLVVSKNASSTLPYIPETEAAMMRLVNADGVRTRIYMDGYGGVDQGYPGIVFRTGNGTAASPTAVLSGATLGMITVNGYKGTSYGLHTVPVFRAYAGQNYDDNNGGTGVVLSTRNNGPANLTGNAQALKISPNGNVLVAQQHYGGTSDATASFQVQQLELSPANSAAARGTISVTASSGTVTGTNTQFLNTFRVGQTITANGETRTISAIASNTSMTTNAWTNTATNVDYTFTYNSNIFSVYGNGNVYASDRLGVGSLPTTKFTVNSSSNPTPVLPSFTGVNVHILGADGVNNRMVLQSSGTGQFPVLTFVNSRGTNAAPTATQTGDFLGNITGQGYGATGYQQPSTKQFITQIAAANWTDTDQPTYTSLWNVNTGSTIASEKIRLFQSGNIGMQTSGAYSDDGTNKLQVTGSIASTGLNITGQITQYGGNPFVQLSAVPTGNPSTYAVPGGVKYSNTHDGTTNYYSIDNGGFKRDISGTPYTYTGPAFSGQLAVSSGTVISSMLKANSIGQIVAATAGSDYAVGTTTPVISSGSGAPASTPGKIGDVYVDITGAKLYFAKGAASSADWTIAN